MGVSALSEKRQAAVGSVWIVNKLTRGVHGAGERQSSSPRQKHTSVRAD